MFEERNMEWRSEARSPHDLPKKEDLRYETIAGKERYRAFLRDQQFATDPFPLSTAPANVDAIVTKNWKALEAEYRKTLTPYEYPVTSDKTDFVNDPNEGYKIHLNIPVAHVRKVSDYLKRENYNHKFLSGGDDPGSVFTLYIGSHRLAFNLAKRLSADLSPFLARPERTDEIELAANIVGRFATGKENRYAKYGGGLRGMSCLRPFESSLWITDPVELQEYLQDAFTATYESLVKDYGEYFHG